VVRARSIMKRYERSYVPWLRDSKFLHELEKDSVDSEIIDEELRSIQLDATTTSYVWHMHVSHCFTKYRLIDIAAGILRAV